MIASLMMTATRISDRSRVLVLEVKTDAAGEKWYLCEIPGEGRAWIMESDIACDPT